MLESSQLLLHALEHLTTEKPPSSPNSECSYSDHCDENELDHAADGSMDFDDTKTNARITALDMPTTLTIFTCYTWLLQGYETIFSEIHNSLLSRTGTRTHKPTYGSPQAVIPGLRIGGFAFDDHRDLQIEVLMQISIMMLERVDDVLGISAASQRHESNALTTKTSRGKDSTIPMPVLDAWSRQGGFPSDGKAMTLKKTMEDIRRILRRP